MKIWGSLIYLTICLHMTMLSVPPQMTALRKLKYVYFSRKDIDYLRDHNKKICVLNFLPSDWMGGVESCVIAQHDIMHRALHFKSLMFVYHESPVQKNLFLSHLPHYSSHANKLRKYDFGLYQRTLSEQIRKLCIRHNVDIIHCHKPYHLELLRNAIAGLQVKLVLMYHGSKIPESDYPSFKNLDGIIAVNLNTKHLIEEANQLYQLDIKNIVQIFPPFNEKKFLNYKPIHGSRKEFFKQTYACDIGQAPLICNIGNFYGPAIKPESKDFVFEKNQEVLVKALYILIHERKKKVQALFVGDGPNRVWHEQLSKQLNLAKHIHFLGFCNEIHKILSYIDIHVLPSHEESVGIATLEASLMKKPSIGSSGTGSEQTIVHNQTGFIFNNNDANDLADKLEQLIDNPELRMTMGNNACKYVTNRNNFGRPNAQFTQEAIYKKLSTFYKRLIMS